MVLLIPLLTVSILAGEFVQLLGVLMHHLFLEGRVFRR